MRAAKHPAGSNVAAAGDAGRRESGSAACLWVCIGSAPVGLVRGSARGLGRVMANAGRRGDCAEGGPFAHLRNSPPAPGGAVGSDRMDPL